MIVSSLNDFSSSLSAMEEEYQTYNNYDELIKYSLGFHAEYTTSKKLLEGVANLSQKYKAPVFMHNSETESEVAQCVGRYGMTPTTFLDSLGMFEYGGGGYHCVWMSGEDLDIFDCCDKPGIKYETCERNCADLRDAEKEYLPRNRNGRTGEQQLSRYVPRDVPCDRTWQTA